MAPTGSGPVASPPAGSYPAESSAIEALTAANSVRVSLAQALGLGPLLRRHLLSPVGMLPGLCRQWATCIGEPPVHLGAVLLGLGNRLRRFGDLLPQRSAPRLRLLGSLHRIGLLGSGSAMIQRYPPRSSATAHPAGSRSLGFESQAG
jgi:hypothetical protein